MLRHREIHQRDDGQYDVVCGNVTAGPFPSRAFAEVIAEGREPEPAPKRRRWRAIREVLHIVRT
ncbi:hypothetical protein E3H11_31170 [Bradyrhizobium brasilense]|uniref:hypothetical protein n=1 Tax=Bradyrhizobium brasilense TaxID=1419277 RepID=UPI00145674FF|nr:hypothetical protein [Bradyrhizobium brasilense]NLS73290.1 hypothetical protein [Bradyrhizobium brasilense]